MSTPTPSHQRGAVLIVGLVLLVVITLMVASAFTLSVSNLQSVGNMQFRNEAIAAANKAIEQKIGSLCPSGCTTAPTSDEIQVDLNNDGTTDYTVTIATPTCISRSAVISTTATGGGSSASLGLSSTTYYFNTVWDIDATVSDSVSGASVHVRQGARMLLTQTQCNAVCPPATGLTCS